MSGGFQTAVTNQPALGVAGDFANMNPYFTVPFGPGGAVAGIDGAFVGRFAWAVPPDDANQVPATINSHGIGPVTGFVHRVQQGLITLYLADASMLIQRGFQMGLCNGGDFLAKNDGVAVAIPGQKAYANFADGKVTFAAAGAPTGGGSGSASTVAATTFAVTGAIAGNILTVSAVGSGSVYPGATISGTNVVAGTKIVSQIGGTPNGVGTYYVSIGEQTVASTAISGTYGLLTIGGTVVAGFGVGDTISGSSVVAGTSITALGTGVGAAGTYIVDNNTVVSSTAITANAVNVETKWYCMSTGLPGEIVKISDHPNG